MAAPAGRLSGKLALVTGSTKGIGKAIATVFLREGADVILNSRNQADVDCVAKELRGGGMGGGGGGGGPCTGGGACACLPGC